jgi:hypothetical protein
MAACYGINTPCSSMTKCHQRQWAQKIGKPTVAPKLCSLPPNNRIIWAERAQSTTSVETHLLLMQSIVDGKQMTHTDALFHRTWQMVHPMLLNTSSIWSGFRETM